MHTRFMNYSMNIGTKHSAPNLGLFDRRCHFIQHLRLRNIAPTMAAAWTVDDLRFSGWIGVLKRILEHVNSIIQIIIVGFTDRYVNFPTKLRGQSSPASLEKHAQVV